VAEKKGSSSRPASGLSKARQGDLVFERLTNPQNFTGAQKAKFDSGVTQANQASVREQALLSNSRGRNAANNNANANTANSMYAGANQAAGLQGGGAALSSFPLKKLAAGGVVPSLSGSGGAGGPLLASSLSGSQSARLLAASSSAASLTLSAASGGAGGGDVRSPSPADGSSETGSGSAALAKLPFHERLSDPRTFTGAQKQKFADPHPKIARVGGSGGALGLRDSVPSVPLGGRGGGGGDRLTVDDNSAGMNGSGGSGAPTGGRPGHHSHRSMSFDRSMMDDGAPGSGGGPRSGGGGSFSRGATRGNALLHPHGGGVTSPTASSSSSHVSSSSLVSSGPAGLERSRSPSNVSGNGNGTTEKENRGESLRPDGTASVASAPVGKHKVVSLSLLVSPPSEDVDAGADVRSPPEDEVVEPNFFVSPRTEMHDTAASSTAPAAAGAQ
jgi:hypothetical protein